MPHIWLDFALGCRFWNDSCRCGTLISQTLVRLISKHASTWHMNAGYGTICWLEDMEILVQGYRTIKQARIGRLQLLMLLIYYFPFDIQPPSSPVQTSGLSWDTFSHFHKPLQQVPMITMTAACQLLRLLVFWNAAICWMHEADNHAWPDWLHPLYSRLCITVWVLQYILSPMNDYRFIKALLKI